jgi:UDPglucose 6-dehydrogenase
MNKVLIVGHGHVGSAMSSIFKPSEKIIIDPKHNKCKISDCTNKQFSVIFVCVDTPKNEKFKTLHAVLTELNATFHGAIVCCKSTASPQFYSNAEKTFKNIRLIFSPEFLSHKTNIVDFNNQKFLIFGGNKAACIKVANILKPRLKTVKNIAYTDIQTAALVKYTSNSFLACKITFFNEMWLLHKKLGCSSSFEEYTKLVSLDDRVGASHMIVPGTDTKFGWGGHCYDKDIHELATFSKSALIQYITVLNSKHRKHMENNKGAK